MDLSKIIEFVQELDFSDEQFLEIKKGVADGLTEEQIAVYARPEFGWKQMEVIRMGLRDGIDVLVYAKPEFDSHQMNEIQYGLRQKLNVSVYAKPEFSDSQMYIIREGLADGVDVSSYAKPELDVETMGNIRMRLLRELNEQ